MTITAIDAEMLKRMFLSAAKGMEAKKEEINELNVFPVPDGDTGTNMTMTIMAAAREVNQISKPDMEILCKAMSSGSLRGARGNSGVILSQLLRGFTKGIKEHEQVTVPILAKAFSQAVETAYRAVMKPKEGTILTVAKGGAEKAVQMAEETKDIVRFADEVILHMQKVLKKTPDMLPVLKEAGVVDSGGQGLLTILKSGCDVLHGKEIPFDQEVENSEKNEVKAAKTVDSSSISTSEIHFGYCTEFIILLSDGFPMAQEQEFKAYLMGIGDCVVVVSDDEVVKVHVHTNDPGLAIQKALGYGELSNLKIDNMRLEHNEKLISEQEKKEALKEPEMEVKKPEGKRKPAGFISVSSGEGMEAIFKDLGVDYVISGGQTMNPSTEDMLNAVDMVNADTIFILPNNKNIILAAQQAKELTEDKEIIVIPSKNEAQGIAAVIHYIHDKTGSENEKNMISEMEKVHCGQVTYAVRDTVMDGRSISQGDIMGIGDGEILSVEKEIEAAAEQMLSQMLDEEKEFVTIYYGEERTEEDAKKLVHYLEENYPEVETEVCYGGQPLYYYLISVE